MSNPTINQPENVCPDVDSLLREFFVAEMPRPWPILTLSSRSRARRVGSFWSGTHARLALAACVTLLVAGYWTLSGFFPRQEAATGVQQGPHISMKEPPSLKAVEKQPDQRPALVPMKITSPQKNSGK